MANKKKSRVKKTKPRAGKARRPKKAVKAIPAGYHSVTPYLIVQDATRALDFYRQALGAKELVRMPAPGGKVGHAEIKIGDSVIMLADEFPDMGARSPRSIGGSPVSLMVYTKDCDALYTRALELGAVSKQAPEDKFYGDRNCQIEDPFGHTWALATHKEDVSPAEMQRRLVALGVA